MGGRAGEPSAGKPSRAIDPLRQVHMGRSVLRTGVQFWQCVMATQPSGIARSLPRCDCVLAIVPFGKELQYVHLLVLVGDTKRQLHPRRKRPKETIPCMFDV